MPRDFALDVPASLLSLSLDGPSGLRSESFTLRLLGVAPETRSGDWLARKVAVSSYLLALSPESARKLRELQNLAGAASTTFRQFRVQARLAKQPPQPRDLQIWVDVKLDSSQGFVPLIDGAKLPYDDKLG